MEYNVFWWICILFITVQMIDGIFTHLLASETVSVFDLVANCVAPDSLRHCGCARTKHELRLQPEFTICAQNDNHTHTCTMLWVPRRKIDAHCLNRAHTERLAASWNTCGQFGEDTISYCAALSSARTRTVHPIYYAFCGGVRGECSHEITHRRLALAPEKCALVYVVYVIVRETESQQQCDLNCLSLWFK